MNKYFFQRAQFLTNLFDAIPSMLFIVDADVKVVHLNAAAKKVHGSRPEHIFLKSSGSVMNCIHAAEATGGCGTSSSCQGCVIRRSVREAAEGRKIQRHSTKMEVVDAEGSREVHIMLTASPFAYENEPLILLIIEDISDLKRVEDELKRANELLERRATTDTLTGIFNRLRFNEFLEREIGEARRYEHPLALIMLDIDHFKKTNDTFGHHAGDCVLRDLAGIITGCIRQTDVFARWGGEEFMVLSSHTDLEQSGQLAEKLRSSIEEHHFDGPGRITCSFGVTAFDSRDTIESFTGRADAALYQAKTAGRNCVMMVEAVWDSAESLESLRTIES